MSSTSSARANRCASTAWSASGPTQRPSWWVLDYKLAFDAAADEDLRRQLTRYRDAVQALVGDAPVHAAFVTGDGALHELEAPRSGRRITPRLPATSGDCRGRCIGFNRRTTGIAGRLPQPRP